MDLSNIIKSASALYIKPRPIVLFHKPTARCDCRCNFCDSWVHQPEKSDILDSEKILEIIDKALKANMTTYTVWGGEPLIADNLPDWLMRAHSKGMDTIVCTSGYRLPERAKEIAPYIRRLLLSIEAIGEKHDKIRGTKGLFKRITVGIEEFNKNGKNKITIWSNLSRENADQAKAIAKFAKEQGVYVEFFPAALYPGFNEKTILNKDERKEIFEEIKSLKKSGYPIINTAYSLDLMGQGNPFRCNIPKYSILLQANGQVYACEPRIIPGLKPYGDIDSLDLDKIGSSDIYQRTYRGLASCNNCLLPCVASMANSILMQSFRKALNKIYYGIEF